MARVRTDEERARAAAWQREYRRRNADAISAYYRTDEYRARNAARARRDWAENRNGVQEKTNARSREYKKRNPEKVSVARRPRDLRLRMSRHGPKVEEWVAQALAAQGGLCYLCGDRLGSRRDIAIDHDHTCCPPAFSCSACRRGLACQRCNRLIGQVDDDPALLRRIADALDGVLAPTRARIAATVALQLTLDADQEVS